MLTSFDRVSFIHLVTQVNHFVRAMESDVNGLVLI